MLKGRSMKYPVCTFGIKNLYCIDVSCAKIKQCSPSYNPMLSLFPFFLFIFKSNFLSCSLCSQAVWRWGWRPDSGLRWSTTPGDPLLTGTISDPSQVLELPSNTNIFSCINCLVVEKNRFEKIFPRRANLTKAISVDANEAKAAFLSLKRTKSTQDECYSPLD